MSTQTPLSSTDIPTIVSISIVAYALEIVVHEIIGHGGVCLLVGGQPLAVTSTDLFCKLANNPEWKYKFMVTGGGLVNFLSVLLCLALIRYRKYNPHTAYFLWVFMNINLFLASSYLIGSPLLGFGDWDSFVSDLPLSIVWRVLFALAGVILSFWGIKISVAVFEIQFGQVENDKANWVKLLSRVPPFTVGTVGLLMGFLNPLDLKWSISLAAASFIGLLWMFNLHAWIQTSNNKDYPSKTHVLYSCYLPIPTSRDVQQEFHRQLGYLPFITGNMCIREADLDINAETCDLPTRCVQLA